MKKIILMIFIFFVYLILNNSILRAEEIYEIFKYLPVDIGNKWVYEMHTTKGLSQGDAVRAFESKEVLDGREVYICYEYLGSKEMKEMKTIFYQSFDEEGIYVHKIVDDKGGYSIFSPPLPLFPKDLQLGQEYSNSVAIKIYDSNDKMEDEGTAEARIKLESIEDVDVPAGNFKNCLKIHFIFTQETKMGSSLLSYYIWFAPDIGRVKEHRIFKDEEDENNTLYFEQRLKEAIVKGNRIGREIE